MNQEDDLIRRNIERTNRYRRKLCWSMTAEERLKRAMELTEQAFGLIQADPVARKRFLHRNLKQRRESIRSGLESKLMKDRPSST